MFCQNAWRENTTINCLERNNAAATQILFVPSKQNNRNSPSDVIYFTALWILFGRNIEVTAQHSKDSALGSICITTLIVGEYIMVKTLDESTFFYELLKNHRIPLNKFNPTEKYYT